MKKLLEEIRLSKVAYLLEIIEKRNVKLKIKAYNKLKKIKITKSIGLFLIENSTREYNLYGEFGEMNASIIELCFNNYYDEYSPAIKNIFKDLNKTARDKVIYLLSTSKNDSALVLYSELIIKYYKDEKFIIVGDLPDRPTTYKCIFPKLYKTLKYDCIQNNVLILISNYLSYGIIPKDHLKKNKKLIIDSICKVFEEGLKYKHKNTFAYLNDENYRRLRYYLELSINIELYVSNKRTKEYLEKLYKKNDNQLKLFILDNYYRKGIDIDKLSFKKIENDLASRYPLFELLNVYEKTDLMSKKSLQQVELAKSDFYINFQISFGYNFDMDDINFYKKVTINDYDYYVFKFKCTYKYDSFSNDFLTDYICNTVGIDKLNGENITESFIGISGGYIINKTPSVIKYNHDKLLFSKIDENSDIDNIINTLIPKQKKVDTKKSEKNVKQKKRNSIFSYILIFLFAIFISLFVYFILYIYGVGNIGVNMSNNNLKSVEIDSEYTFSEVNATDIFNKDKGEYYVLFYKVSDSGKSVYFNYINEYLKRNIKFYYVDLNKDENKFLYTQNDMNFTITNKDRLLKVNDNEYEYYIDGKSNILSQMKSDIEEYLEEENN